MLKRPTKNQLKIGTRLFIIVAFDAKNKKEPGLPMGIGKSCRLNPVYGCSSSGLSLEKMIPIKKLSPRCSN
jgi:hypothetical protein